MHAMTYAELPEYCKSELKVAEMCRKMAVTAWPVNRPLMEQHIATLEAEMAKLEADIMPRVPLTATPKESKIRQKDWRDPEQPEFNYVKKPFTSTGKWGKPTAKHWSDFTKCDDGMIYNENARWYNYEVWGPYSRIEWTKMSLTSDKQVKQYLLSIGWKPDTWNISKAGKNKGKVTGPKLTMSSLDSIKDDTGKLIAQHLKCQHRKSMFEGWIKILDERGDGRIPSEVNPQGCPTVRMTHKNIVNVPSPEKKQYFAKECREVFIADPGYKLVGADADACQLRMLAHYMDDDEFTEALLHGDKDKGTDLHTLNMKKAGLPSRGHAKNFIYGFLFGAGAEKVGKLINKDAKAGKKIIDQYLDGLPKLKALRKGLKQRWEQRGYLIGLDGRRLYVRQSHELLCYLLQGGEAILMKLAMCYLQSWIDAEGLDARLLCVMHDEYTWMVREDQAERVAYLSETAIEMAGLHLHTNVPMTGSSKIGDNWYEIH